MYNFLKNTISHNIKLNYLDRSSQLSVAFHQWKLITAIEIKERDIFWTVSVVSNGEVNQHSSTSM